MGRRLRYSAIDSQALAAETPGGQSTVQALLDALALKIKEELVTNEALLEKLALYVAKSSIVNNGLTAADVEGMVLDARQANENIEGTLASKLRDLNSDYKNRLIFSGGSQSIRLSSGKSVSSTGNGMQIQIGNNDGYSYAIVCGPDNIVFKKTSSGGDQTIIWEK